MEIKGFTKHNPGHHVVALGWPREDYFLYGEEKDKIVISVADGITRDPLKLFNNELPDLGSLVGEVEMALEYPIPSPAAKSAKVFCESFVGRLRGKKRVRKRSGKGLDFLIRRFGKS